VVALRAGLPERVPAVTVHRNCASGFEAITQASDRMAAGHGEVFLVGGSESMSQIPLLFSQTAARKFGALTRSKSGWEKLRHLLDFRPSDFKPRVGLQLGLTDPVCGLNMGETAEILSREFRISREEQDRLSLLSHQKAAAAGDRLQEEICPVLLTGNRNGKKYTDRDNGLRASQSMEALSKLRPVFDRHTGTVTAGNASQITDGAVALLVMTENACEKHGRTPLGRLLGYHYAGCDPARMGLGPVFAVDGAEKKLGLGLEQADLIEINEAFAAQVLAVIEAAKSDDFCRKHLGRSRAMGEIPEERLNVNGGAIALGHPVGATGARLVLTALKELKRRRARRALVTLCVGGGQGAALWLESV
ncbi:MAG: acetyl-CoA C-acyltransferase, partial [Acidobacteriota bacterium]